MIHWGSCKPVIWKSTDQSSFLFIIALTFTWSIKSEAIGCVKGNHRATPAQFQNTHLLLHYQSGGCKKLLPLEFMLATMDMFLQHQIYIVIEVLQRPADQKSSNSHVSYWLIDWIISKCLVLWTAFFDEQSWWDLLTRNKHQQIKHKGQRGSFSVLFMPKLEETWNRIVSYLLHHHTGRALPALVMGVKFVLVIIAFALLDNVPTGSVFLTNWQQIWIFGRLHSSL